MKRAIFKTDVDRLRERFTRWLGQICKDENYTRLLDANYNVWLMQTRRDQGFPLNPLKIEIDSASLKRYWLNTIKRANLEQLQRLDVIILNEKLDAR